MLVKGSDIVNVRSLPLTVLEQERVNLRAAQYVMLLFLIQLIKMKSSGFSLARVSYQSLVLGILLDIKLLLLTGISSYGLSSGFLFYHG